MQMTRQVTSKNPPGQAAAKRPPAAGRKLRTLAHKAQQTGRVMSRTGAWVAEPLVQSIQKEQPKTLAKMALAVFAPRLATYALRFAIRNPVMTVAGVILVAAVANFGSDADAL